MFSQFSFLGDPRSAHRHTETRKYTHTHTHKAHITHHSPQVVWAPKEERKNGNQYKICSARKIFLALIRQKQSKRDKGGGGGGGVCVVESFFIDFDFI